MIGWVSLIYRRNLPPTLRSKMDAEELIEEIEFDIVMCQKTGNADLIPGLERAIKIIAEMYREKE